MFRAATPCTFATSQLPKVLQSRGVLHILTWKCASRHNAVHFFNASTSKSGPNGATKACTFRLRNLQTFSEHFLFLAFLLPNLLRATMWCNLPRWPRTRRFSEPTCRLAGNHKTLEKTQCFASFPPFRAPASSFFSFFLFSVSFHLCFSICPYCRKFDF